MVSAGSNLPSHLNRYVFRQILANEPIVHRGCLRRHSHLSLRQSTRPPRRSLVRHEDLRDITTCQRRTFLNLNFFSPSKRDARTLQMDPGIEEMAHFAKMQELQARLPQPEQVFSAFTRFFAYKEKHGQSIEDSQARLALRSFQFCQAAWEDAKLSSKQEEVEKWFKLASLYPVFQVLKKSPPTTDHLQLAEVLYAHLRITGHDIRGDHRPMRIYVRLCSLLGQHETAVEAVVEFENRMLEQASNAQGVQQRDKIFKSVKFERTRSSLWTSVLTAFAQNGSEQELLRVLELATKFGVPLSSSMASAVLTFYLSRDSLPEVKKWYAETRERPVMSAKTKPLFAHELDQVLRWCLQHDQLDYGYELVRVAMSEQPSKQIWDVIFIWAAGCGKGADEINRMMSVMEASNENGGRPDARKAVDVVTINRLLEYAISKNDPYLAERFVGIGRERKINPDARTYTLQMEYRLRVKDVDGALNAYKSLQSMDLSSDDDVPMVNRLIVALCDSKVHDFETIMNVTADLADRQAKFDAACVARLSVLHLSRDEVDDVADLLNTHINTLSIGGRDSVRQALLDFIADTRNPVAQAWDAYSLIRTLFDEADREQRTRIFLSFFDHQRPDMAVQVFLAMRNHSRKDVNPTLESYVSFFLAAAKARDRDSVEVIHNQLKLDYRIDVNTRLYNALIIGYTGISQPRRAIVFWNEIAASAEGPNYNSLHVTFRACERAPFGDQKAQEIWARLRRMKVDLDQNLWASYVAALAGNGDNNLALTTLEEAVQKGEAKADAFTLASLYMGAMGDVKKDEIEEWARKKYPAAWAEVEKMGIEEDEDFGKFIKDLDRTVLP